MSGPGAWRVAAAMALALSGLAPAAWAHKASDAYLRLSVDGWQVTLRADIALRDLDRDLVLDADDDGLLRWGEVRGRTADIEALVGRDLRLEVGDAAGAACMPGAFAPLQLDQHSDGRYAVLTRTWSCTASPATASLSYGLFAATDPTHRGILARTMAGSTRTTVIAPGSAALSLPLGLGPASGASCPSQDGGSADPAGSLALFLDGVHHIWIGVDHVLFLVVLLLPAVLTRSGDRWWPAAAWRPAFWRVLGVVTAFTVAHSITLGLAVFDVLNPPSRWVESLIALSVLLAALNNLRPVLVETRWRLTFAFGLVHGFGFASALKDLGLAHADLALPLVLFNLGVEAGQLTIVAALVPLAWTARRWRGYPRWVLDACSVAVAAIAIVWLVERLFDLRLLGLGG
ncbi:HupE/UreJ family protein [Mitsuaria sp. GD03876]|uniref:HupE/UreJ family protein n=1 Tax=Mitsuaria sp. GD03876 TaxID=2975399 RepID=UPI00244B4761|nr:HupE/UreJ family protein [Mitsuaria sp. GD03876]MDH0864381.1 HupE/UreJ family protein [Mitsuaria sp. GD03876]